MSLLKKIHPEQPLKELRWFDIGIVTLIMFGQFIVRSTQMYLASLSPSLSKVVCSLLGTLYFRYHGLIC